MPPDIQDTESILFFGLCMAACIHATNCDIGNKFGTTGPRGLILYIRKFSKGFIFEKLRTCEVS